MGLEFVLLNLIIFTGIFSYFLAWLFIEIESWVKTRNQVNRTVDIYYASLEIVEKPFKNND